MDFGTVLLLVMLVFHAAGILGAVLVFKGWTGARRVMRDGDVPVLHVFMLLAGLALVIFWFLVSLQPLWEV